MGLLGFRKKKGIVDLTERHKRQQEKASEIKKVLQDEPQVSPFGGTVSFFDRTSSSAVSNSEQSENLLDSEDKRKRLARRLMDMTTKIEELSNSIYRLQQRVELLERKKGVEDY